MSHNINLRTLISSLILATLLSACGDDTPEMLIASAKINLDKNETKTAIIQIKNALQGNPDLAEARFLLGKALLTDGDPATAQIEFEKARNLKYSDDLVVPQLAKALNSQGKFKKVTDEFATAELLSTGAKADLQISLTVAYAAQGKTEPSQSALNAALSFEPENTDALILKVRSLGAKNDFPAALSLINSVIEKNPKNPDAYKLKGDILQYGNGDIEGALVQYQNSIDAKPTFFQGYSASIGLLLQQNKLEAVEKQLTSLKKFSENNPQTKYFEVQLAYLKKDYLTARTLSQQLLKVAPNNAMGLQLAGAIEFQSKSFLQAETYLAKAISASPKLPLARKLLTLTYLRTGQPDKAMATIAPALVQEPIDTSLYTLAGEVFLQNGDIKKSGEYFAKASKLDPKDGRKRTSLALIHMISGDTANAFNELDNISESDAGITADLALISANLRRQDFAKALKAIDSMEKKQPTNPLASNLRGKILLAQKNYGAARKSFESAVALNQAYFPAIASLAALDVFEKKPEDAKKRFENVLSQNPKNSQALLGLAELRARSGGTKEEVAELISRAVTANPIDVTARVLLVDFYLQNKDLKLAFSTAQDAATTMPESLEVLDALGRAQQASGDTNQAILTYKKLANLQPLSPKPFLRLAEINILAKNLDEAEKNMAKALEIKPDLINAQRGLVMLNIGSEKYQDAVATSRVVQRQRPKDVVGYMLEGEVYVAQKKWNDALTVYRLALKQTSSLEPAIKIHAILNASGNKIEADKFSASWLKEHTKDAGFIAHLADEALIKKDYISADKLYSNIVQIQPNNAIAYNNLAWINGQLNKDSAVGYAEKAMSLAPNQPAFMDTMALLLANMGNYKKAIDLQSDVVKLQPENTLFKLNFAKILVKAGDKKQAKNLLEDLSKLGTKFSAQDEVNAILKNL
jgi:putative PEP-CTERM system TPR-repeat lipoprotein